MEGLNFAAPPVALGFSTREQSLLAVLSDSAQFGMGAGGFARVPALPQLVLAHQPANPASNRALEESSMFAFEGLSIR